PRAASPDVCAVIHGSCLAGARAHGRLWSLQAAGSHGHWSPRWSRPTGDHGDPPRYGTSSPTCHDWSGPCLSLPILAHPCPLLRRPRSGHPRAIERCSRPVDALGILHLQPLQECTMETPTRLLAASRANAASRSSRCPTLPAAQLLREHLPPDTTFQ